MEFVYLAEKTPDAPKRTVILGHVFIDKEVTKVTEEKHIKKFCGMEHIGIIEKSKFEKSKLGKTFFFKETAQGMEKQAIQQDEEEETRNKKVNKDDDKTVKELMPDVIKKHLKNAIEKLKKSDVAE